MRFFNFSLWSILLALPIGVLSAQFETEIGAWESHLPYQSGRYITQSEDKIIYGTEWSLILIDKEELSPEFISKVEGLSDIGIANIHYDENSKSLVIAYTNSNIDIFKNEGITNLPNIKNNTTISGDKAIYDINTNANRAYLSTGFGLVELDLNTFDFGFTTFTGIKVNTSIVFKNQLLIGTDEGIYATDLGGGLNLGDFNNWTFLGSESGFSEIYSVEFMEVFDERLFITVDDELIESDLQGTNTIVFAKNTNENFHSLSADYDHLLLGYRKSNGQSDLFIFEEDLTRESAGFSCTDRITGALEDQFDRVWYADEWNTLRYSENLTDPCIRINYETPYSHKSSDIAVKDGSLYVASGGVSDNYNYFFDRNGFYIYEEGTWTNYQENQVSFLKENDLLNLFKILPHPSVNKVFIGSYWGGLIEFDRDTEEMKLYGPENSSLRGGVGDPARERIAGLQFDEDENLWVTNYLAERPFSVLTPDGSWQSFDFGSRTQTAQIVVDRNNYKWVTIQGDGGGVMVYDSGEEVLSTGDDRKILLNTSNSEITNNRINDVEIDRDGIVWVATAEGPVLFDCGPEVIEGECEGRRIKVLQDSIAAFLLADVEIRNIEIDGANRKWFGTRNGIFVQDATGDEQVLRFTTNNSPLFDDNIVDLAYDGKSGLVYISSNKGIQAYRTQTLDGGRGHASNVVAYPNPVRPDYFGPIAIRGLPNEANVKITDLNGKLVFETTSLGGQAIWDGKNLNGAAIQSGVYLIFSTTTDLFLDTDTHVGKILVVR